MKKLIKKEAGLHYYENMYIRHKPSGNIFVYIEAAAKAYANNDTVKVYDEINKKQSRLFDLVPCERLYER